MGLLSGLLGGGEQPKREIIDLDQGTKKLIEQGITDVGRPVEKFEEDLNRGIENQAFDQSPAQVQQDAARTAQDPAMMDAILSKYSAQSGDAMGRLRRQNKLQAEMNRAKKAEQMSQIVSARQRIETRNYAFAAQAYAQAEAARSQTLASVLGVIGMGAGMYAGSRVGQQPSVDKTGGTGMFGQPQIEAGDY